MSQTNKPKYLWAFIGYIFFAGLLTGFVVNPIFEQLAQFSGASSTGAFRQIYWVTNTTIGFIIFRFFVWYFVTRSQAAVHPESKPEFTEQARPSDENAP